MKARFFPLLVTALFSASLPAFAAKVHVGYDAVGAGNPKIQSEFDSRSSTQVGYQAGPIVSEAARSQGRAFGQQVAAIAKSGSSGDAPPPLAVAAVPVPAAVWLFGTAVLALGLVSRRRAA